MDMKFQRAWGMPSADTFDCEPIKGFVQKYLMRSKVSVDPFARNKRWATYTNDLNPATAAEYHMEAVDFIKKLVADGVQADLVVFDPPYSPRQVKEVYDTVGMHFGVDDQHNTGRWTLERDLISTLCPSGTVLSFGWNSQGMGKGRGFEPVDILLVCHGGAHNDTICIAEQRLPKPVELALA